MDLTTAIPAEIDTALAEIYSRYYTLDAKVAQHTAWIEDYEQGLAKFEAGDARYTGHTQERLTELLNERDALMNARFDVLTETHPYGAEFTRRGGWSRFHLVQNNGGHVHSSMNCSTCYSTTRFGWLPEWSGQSEDEALQALGAQGNLLCTVCFPSAPASWTKKDEGVCAGSGKIYDSSLPNRTGFYTGNWAECSVCHTNQTITKAYKIRKHQSPTS